MKNATQKKLTKGRTPRAFPTNSDDTSQTIPNRSCEGDSTRRNASAPDDVKEDTGKRETDGYGGSRSDLEDLDRGRDATDLSVSFDEEEAREEQDATYRTFLHSINTGDPFTLPFEKHVVCAARHNREVHHDGNREDELKQSKGREGYRSAMFEFVRSVKSHPDMAGEEADEALDLVKDILRGHVDPHDPWREFYDLSDDVTTEEDAMAEFMEVWDRITHLRCADPLTQALKAARERPVTFPGARKLNALSTGRLFLAVAAHLQLARSGLTIKLPCVRLGKELGVSAMTISRYRKLATEAQVLREPKARVKRNDAGKIREDATEFTVDLRALQPLAPDAGAAAPPPRPPTPTPRPAPDPKPETGPFYDF